MTLEERIPRFNFGRWDVCVAARVDMHRRIGTAKRSEQRNAIVPAAYRVVPSRRNSFDLGVRMSWRGNRRLQPRGRSAGQAECLAILHVIVYTYAMQRTIRLQLQPSPAQA